MFCRKGILLSALMLALLPAQAGAEDLLEIYSLARAHDARWAAAQAAAAAGEEKLAQGRAGLLPSLTANGSRTWYDSSLTYQTGSPFTGGNRNYDSREYGASLTQPLFRMQNIAQYRQSRSQFDLAGLQRSLAQAELMLRVAQAYFDVLLAHESVELAVSQVAAYQEERDQAEARLKAGVSAITDVHEAQARLDLAISQELAARNDLAIKREAMRRVIGQPPGALARLQDDVATPSPGEGDVDHWLKLANENNLQIRAQQLAVEVARLEVSKAHGAHYPTVDAVAGYNVTTATGSVYSTAESDLRVKSAGVQLQVPLFQGGGASSRAREAGALHEKAVQELEDARRLVTQQTQQAWLDLQHSNQQIAALKRALQSAQSQLDATRAGIAVGLRNRVDALNATQQLFNIKRDLARARLIGLLALLRLQDAAGQLDQQHLEQINNLLARNQPATPQQPGPASAP